MLAALFVVALYMVSVCAVSVIQTETPSEAAAGTKGYYTYKITPSGAVTDESGVESKTPTSVGVSDVSSGWNTSDGTSNMGSWAFDSKTGIGPFNSFYAAFDPTNGNKFLGKLNPYNLGAYLDTSKGSVPSTANIMWILPTVYWKTDSDNNLILTNDPAVGTAYAHTVNGVTYQYLAIGVYEASGDATALYSATGGSPTMKIGTSSITMGVIKGAMNGSISTQGATDSNGISMLWNFYQYSLYKYCVATVIGGFLFTNVGGGPSMGAVNTGLLDGSGPYSHASGDGSMKLFIENVWGGGADAIGDAYIDGRGNLITVSDPTKIYAGVSGNASIKVEQGVTTDTGAVFPAATNTGGSNWRALDGYITEISTQASTWGLPVATSTTASNTMGYAYSSPKYDDRDIYHGSTSVTGTYDATTGLVTGTDGEKYYSFVSQMNIYCAYYAGHDGVNQVSGYWWQNYTGVNNQVGRLAFVYSENVEEVSQTETVGSDTVTWRIAEDAKGGTCMYLPEPRSGVAGYTFSGWYSKNTFEDEYKVGNPGDPWVLSTDNAKLYGKWVEVFPTTKEFQVTLKKTEDGKDKITVHIEPPDGWGGLEAGKVTIRGTYYRILDGEDVRSYGQITGIDGIDLEAQSLAWIGPQDLEFTLPEGWNAYLIYAEYEVTDEDAEHYGTTVRTAYVIAEDDAIQGA